MKDYVNSAALQEYTTKLVAKLKTLFPGTPTAAATVADMTDHSKTYVYVGSETGYTAGDWYYWNGTAWTSGGPFQATSIITDTTLAVAGEAADAKATGDAIAAAKAAVLNAMAPAYSPSATYAVGAYVNHNGAIYRCTTAITTAEAWTAGHWAAVPLGADLEGQVSDLKTQLAQSICEYEPAWIQGRVLSDGTFDDTQTTYRRTDFIDVSVLSGMPIKNTNPTYSAYLYEYSSNDVQNFITYTQIYQNATTTFVPNARTKYVVLSKTPRFVDEDYLTYYTKTAAYVLTLSNSDRIDGIEKKTDCIVISKNLLDGNGTFTKDTYIKHDGTTAYSGGWYLAEQYIEIIPGKSYTLLFWNGNAWSKDSSSWYSFYTQDKTPLGGQIISSNYPAVAPSNAKYLRVSFGTAVYNGQPMVGTVEDMNSVAEYIPFGNSIKDYSAVTSLENIVNKFDIVLPQKCYAVVDTEFNIYTKNVVVVNNYNDFDYYWVISARLSPSTPAHNITYNLYSDCLRFTPNIDDMGSYNITLNIKRHSDWKTVASKKIELEVLAKTTLTSKHVVFIGDSLTNAGYYPYEIQNVLSSGGVESVGTRISNVWIESVQHTIAHEGRGGWSINDYVTKASRGEEPNIVINSFWNPATSKFDFAYWLSNNGFTMPDAVFLNLGTNAAYDVDANITGLNEMIASIRQSSATVPIIISLITPPATQDGWTYAVHGGSADQFAVQQMALNARYISEYDGRESENIYLSTVYFNLDRYHDYNNVHPSYYGYLKCADVYWAMIQKLLS